MVRALRSSILLITLAAVVLTGTACRSPRVPAASPSLASTATIGTSTTTGTSDAVLPQGASDPAAPPQPLKESQAKALEAELRAIEDELDALDLPTDSDFEDIESALP